LIKADFISGNDCCMQRLRRKSGRISDANFGLFPKDGLLKELLLGLMAIEDHAEIMND
jgi:hypothetical protein